MRLPTPVRAGSSCSAGATSLTSTLRRLRSVPAFAYRPRRRSVWPLVWIALLAGKTPLSLAAGRGVEGPEEVIKYLLAGADVVHTTSSLLRHGASHLDYLVAGLAEWIEAHGAGSVDEIRGRLRADRLAQPEALLRAQYVRSLLLEHPFSK